MHFYNRHFVSGSCLESHECLLGVSIVHIYKIPKGTPGSPVRITVLSVMVIMAFGKELGCITNLFLSLQIYSQENLFVVLKPSSATFLCPGFFVMLHSKGLSLWASLSALLQFKSRLISQL